MEKTNDIDIKDEDLKEDDFTSEELESADADWKAKAQELKGIAKRRATQLGKVKTKLGELEGKIKELSEANPEAKPKPQDKKTEEFGLLQKTYLRSAGIAAEDEVELARDIQKRTGIDWDKLENDDYFKAKLQALRDAKANAAATDVAGGGSAPSSVKNNVEHWLQKGAPPTPKDIPDRKTRVKIINEMVERERNQGGTYYNEK